MDRAAARAELEALLARLSAGRPPLDLVAEAYLFGSYAQGAATPQDLDVDLELDLSDSRAMALVDDPQLSELHRALDGGAELSLSLNQAAAYQAQGFNLARLWQRGQSLAEAVQALDAIERQPLAAQGPDFMLAAFADRELARGERRLLAGLVERAVISVEPGAQGQLFLGPVLGAIRLLGEVTAVYWRQPDLTLARGPRFAELEPALEELGFIWHYLLGDDLPDDDS